MKIADTTGSLVPMSSNARVIDGGRTAGHAGMEDVGVSRKVVGIAMATATDTIA
jgi:dihydroxyacid dehydratase/phosphogluconate dehydratase